MTCPECGATVNSEEEMARHSRQAHGKSEGQPGEVSFICPECGYKATSREDMERHKREMMNDPGHKKMM